MVLLAVLVVIVLGALVGTIALEQSSMTATNARLSFQRRAARAVAWSGVQGVLCELDESRSSLLRGGEPAPTEEWILYEDGTTVARVRLLPIGSAGIDAQSSGAPGAGALIIESESAKVNLNISTAEMLSRLAGMGAEPAGAVRSLAARGGVASVEDIRRAGVDPADEAGRLGGVAIERLATAYSLDPEVQGGESAGRERARWDGQSGSFDARLNVSRGAEEAIERLAGAKVDLASAEAAASALLSHGVEPALWGEIWDAVAFSEDGREGLIDINRASEGVLSCVPGFEGLAGEIVAARTRLGGDRTRGVAWPLEAGVVTREQMAEALPWICTRSLFWRVRVTGEIVRTDGEFGEERLVASVVLDAVIDVSGERARVAYLRDITFSEAAQGIDAFLAEEDGPSDDLDELAGTEDPLGGVDMGDPVSEDGASEIDRSAPTPAADGGGGGAKSEPAPAGRSSGRVRGRWTSGG